MHDHAGRQHTHAVMCLIVGVLPSHEGIKEAEAGRSSRCHMRSQPRRSPIFPPSLTALTSPPVNATQWPTNLSPSQALGLKDDAEVKFVTSLDIREKSLGTNHLLVYNTHRQLADLYIKFGPRDKDKAEHHLTTYLEIGAAIGRKVGVNLLT